MRIRAENYENDWSDFGKEFIVKTRKNTAYFIKKSHFLIRKYAQEILDFNICNCANNINIQNQQKVDMSKIKMRLGIGFATMIIKDLYQCCNSVAIFSGN